MLCCWTTVTNLSGLCSMYCWRRDPGESRSQHQHLTASSTHLSHSQGGVAQLRRKCQLKSRTLQIVIFSRYLNVCIWQNVCQEILLLSITVWHFSTFFYRPKSSKMRLFFQESKKLFSWRKAFDILASDGIQTFSHLHSAFGETTVHKAELITLQVLFNNGHHEYVPLMPHDSLLCSILHIFHFHLWLWSLSKSRAHRVLCFMHASYNPKNENWNMILI